MSSNKWLSVFSCLAFCNRRESLRLWWKFCWFDTYNSTVELYLSLIHTHAHIHAQTHTHTHKSKWLHKKIFVSLKLIRIKLIIETEHVGDCTHYLMIALWSSALNIIDKVFNQVNACCPWSASVTSSIVHYFHWPWPYRVNKGQTMSGPF